jgi:hypothetical protein
MANKSNIINSSNGKEGDKPAPKNKDGNNNDQNEIDLKSIQGNVNYVKVDNLFYHENYNTKLSYTDYCCITEDFTTHQLGN